MRLYSENLVKRYGARTVVKGVSIEVHQGEIVGLLGPNGAGKIRLARVMELVWERGYLLGNADITIAAQKPKMAPHLLRMREVLSSIMKVDVERVSVKATTTERLGFVGREEGIEVWASVILLKN